MIWWGLAMLMVVAPVWAGVSPSVPAGAVSPTVMLEDVLAQVALQAPQVLAGDEAAIAAAARSRGALGKLLPTVSYEGDWSVREATTGTTRSTSHPRGDSLVLVQPLTLGEEWSGWRNAENTAEAARAEAAVNLQNIRVRTVAAYADVLAAADEIANARTLRQALENQLQGAELRLKVGEGTKTDVAQSKARLAQAVAAQASAAANHATARAQLEQLAGVVAGEPVWPGQPPAVAAPAGDHPSLAAASARRQAQQATVAGAWFDMLPEASLRASSNQSRDTTFLGGNTVEDQTVLVTLSLPLFAGGQNVAALQAAKAELRRSGYTLEDTRREIARLQTSARAQLDAAEQTLHAARDEVAAQGETVEGLRRENQLGTRSLLEVLDGEQELAAARTRLATARRNALVARYNLLAAEGRLVAGVSR